MKQVISTLAAVAALSACSTVTPARAPLAGTWAPVSAEMGGQALPLAAFQGARLVLSDSNYEFAGDRGSYTVLSQEVPGRMEIHGQSGPNAGKTIPALYKLDADQLVISYQLGQGAQPADFSSPAGTMVLVIHYKRAA